MKKLTSKEALFVAYYLGEARRNGAAAARMAGYSPRSATAIAAENLTKPHIRRVVEQTLGEVVREQKVTTQRVLAEIAGVAFADTNELVEVRVGACRYCHGTEHQYQFTQRELAEKLEEKPGFRAPGGIGYDPRREAHPDCPECFGEGEPRTILKDSAKASPEARKLFAGAKVGDKGIEVRTHDKLRANEMLGRHLKLFKDTMAVTFPELPPEQRRERIRGILQVAAKRRKAAGEKEAG